MLTTIAIAQLPVLVLLLVAGTVAKIWTAARESETGYAEPAGAGGAGGRTMAHAPMLCCAFGELS